MSANVNHPTNVKEKEADVNRKLQLYGIVNAFQNGKVPSNEQIDVALNSFLASKALSSPPNKLSDEGKVLIQDVRDVVEQAKQLLLSKNEGNLLQDFIWQTTQFDPKAVDTPNAPVSKESAQRDGDEALQGLRTLGTLLITNGQFRKLLNDATTLLRDIAGDTATHAAQKVRPSEEDLQQMDRPAADNTWHEKPDLSKDNIKQQAQGIYGGKPKEDAKDVAHAAQSAAVPDQGASHPNQVDQNAGKNEAKNAVQNKIDQRVDPETKDKAKEAHDAYKQKAKNYFNKKMPEERKDQIIWRLKKMVLECQQHPDYSEAIQTLLRLAENYGRHGRVLGKGAAGTAQEGRSGLAAAEADLRTLIERFANGTSTSELWSGINVIYKDAEKDDELRNWFKNMNNYVRRCLLEQGYILEDESSREWDRLYEQGRYLLRDKYRTHTDRVVDEIKFIADQFDQDPKNKAFAASLQKLFKDLGNDSNGQPTFKPHLIKDLTETIIPAILESTAYIPIPRIEYTDNQVDAIIENLVLESDNFMPNIMEVASDNYWRWGRKKIASSHKNSMDIKVSGIQMDLRDVSYHIKKKQGFPSITDTGIADILLPGDGFSFRMKVSTAEKNDKENYFKVQKVDVDIEDLKIKLKKSNHKVLFGLFKPIMLKALRPPMQKAVEKAIKDECNKLDQLFFQIKQEADRAMEEAKENPEEAPNVYQRYYNAAQKRILQGKEKAENKVADKKVNYAVTQEESLFPNIKLPGGISSKATEYKELARKGERWESPVFSIGQASKSTNLPGAPKIETKTRPAHASTGAGYGTTGAGYGTTGAGYGTTGAGYGDAYGATNGGYTNGSTLGGTNGNGKAPVNPIGSNPVTGAPQINTI